VGKWEEHNDGSSHITVQPLLEDPLWRKSVFIHFMLEVDWSQLYYYVVIQLAPKKQAVVLDPNLSQATSKQKIKGLEVSYLDASAGSRVFPGIEKSESLKNVLWNINEEEWHGSWLFSACATNEICSVRRTDFLLYFLSFCLAKSWLHIGPKAKLALNILQCYFLILKRTSKVSVHWCSLKPYLLISFCRIKRAKHYF